MTLWKCQVLDHDAADYWREYETGYAESAAEETAERFDLDADMSLLGGEEIRVAVKPADGSKPARIFICTAEQVVQYCAEELDPKPEDKCDIPY